MTIPPAARDKIRAALVKRGDAIRGPALQETGVRGGLYAIAEVQGLDHSHLCRALPAPDAFGNPQPKVRRRLADEQLAGVLALCPPEVRREAREIAEAADEVLVAHGETRRYRRFLAVLDEAERPRPNRKPRRVRQPQAGIPT